MWNKWLRLLTPPTFAGDDEKTRVAALLNAILWIFTAICITAAVLFLFLPNRELSLPLVTVFILGNTGLVWLMRRGRVALASALFLIGFWLLMLSVCVFLGGTYSTSYWSFIVIVVAAGLLRGERGALVFAALSVVAGLGIALAQDAGLLAAGIGVRSPMEQWGTLSLFMLATAGLLNLTSRSLSEALQRARGYAAELEGERVGLEATVRERTLELTRRTRYLEVIAAIAHEATAELELRALMARVVDSISQQFGFYHTGLFLIDDVGEWAELKAASSEGGQRMLVRRHRLRVGQEGIVGYVSQCGESRVALDTGRDRVFFDNSDLPLTRSEVALPLLARGRVIGVLDVQSAEPEAFGREDVAVMQLLADQIATAINNARLFQQTAESVETERRAYRGLAGEAWAKLLNAQTALGFVSDRQAVVPVGDTWTPEMKLALAKGQLITDAEKAVLAIPIKVRGHVIGVIDGRKPDGSQWDPDEIALVQTLAEQSALALESARLYQDTQRRAARERMISEVAGHIRETLDMEAMLRTAAEEMRRALALEDLVVRLAKPKPGRVDADNP